MLIWDCLFDNYDSLSCTVAPFQHVNMKTHTDTLSNPILSSLSHWSLSCTSPEVWHCDMLCGYREHISPLLLICQVLPLKTLTSTFQYLFQGSIYPSCHISAFSRVSSPVFVYSYTLFWTCVIFLFIGTQMEKFSKMMILLFSIKWKWMMTRDRQTQVVHITIISISHTFPYCEQ